MVLISGKSVLTLLLLLAFLPPLFLGFTLLYYSSDTPWNDQWDFVLTLDKFYDGNLSLTDLWQYHNEHRIPVARAVLLAIAWVTHWNLRYEVAANFVVGLATFALIIWKTASTARDLALKNWQMLLPVLSLLVFSLSQWQSWFFGWQLGEFLQILAVVAGLLTLTTQANGWRQFFAAMACGILATFSFGTGLVFWPTGALAIEMQSTRSRYEQWMRRLIWWTVGIFVLIFALWGYQTPPNHPPVTAFVQSPAQFLMYVLAYIGAPVVDYNILWSVIAGAVGIVVLSVLLVRRKLKFSFFLLLSVYGLLGAIMTGIARSGFGVNQALSSRYIPMSTLFWVGLMVLTYVAAMQSHPPVRKFLCTIGLLFFVLLTYNARFGFLQWTERYDFRLPARAELLQGNNLDLLQRLHPDPNLVLERREVLKEHHLSLFR